MPDNTGIHLFLLTREVCELGCPARLAISGGVFKFYDMQQLETILQVSTLLKENGCTDRMVEDLKQWVYEFQNNLLENHDILCIVVTKEDGSLTHKWAYYQGSSAIKKAIFGIIASGAKHVSLRFELLAEFEPPKTVGLDRVFELIERLKIVIEKAKKLGLL